MKRILACSFLAASSLLPSIANGQIDSRPVSGPGIVVPINAEQDVTIINATTTSGNIRHGGILNGTTTDMFTSGFTSTPDLSTFSLTDTLTITTRHGTLTSNDVTLFSPDQRVFTTIARISSGTEIFKGATGTLFISGTSTDGVHYEDRIIGEINIFIQSH